MTKSSSDFLSVALKAAKTAEKIIMHYFDKPLKVNYKPDQSPVTLADTEAEQQIIKTISHFFPDHNIIGEESGTNQSDSTYTWIIDPIDGTHNYSRKIPLFATQIALIKNDHVFLGVSNAPALKELMFAQAGLGAYCNHQKISVSNRSRLSNSYLSNGGLKHFQKLNLIKPLTDLSLTTATIRGIGDAWAYHLLAQGKIDIVVEAKTKIWDIAALALIVEEAGGKVTTITGNQITPKSTSIIATNSLLHAQVLKIFKN